MNNAYAAILGISIFGLTQGAYAGAPLQLTDWQMDAVTAGNAKAITVFQTSAAGRNTASQTSVGNIAVERPFGSFAQSRTAVLSTGAGNASLATDVINQSAAGGHGPAEVATASTVGSANGNTATVRSVDATTAISTSAGPGRSAIGIADSLADVTTFSASGRSH
jgi:hypothetical protein